MTTHTIKEGARVRLIKDHKATGTVDEIYKELGSEYAAVVWDISGCVGEGHIEDLELIPAKQIKFIFQGRDGHHEDLSLTEDEAKETGVYDACVVQRKGRYYTYGGLRKGAFVYNEGKLISLDRSDI